MTIGRAIWPHEFLPVRLKERNNLVMLLKQRAEMALVHGLPENAGLEQLRSALLQQDVPHERTERMHIVTQRLMLRRKVYLRSIHATY